MGSDMPGPTTPATEGGASGAAGWATGPVTAPTLRWSGRAPRTHTLLLTAPAPTPRSTWLLGSRPAQLVAERRRHGRDLVFGVVVGRTTTRGVKRTPRPPNQIGWTRTRKRSDPAPNSRDVASHVMDTVMAPIYRPSVAFPVCEPTRSRDACTRIRARAERAHAILVMSTGPWHPTSWI